MQAAVKSFSGISLVSLVLSGCASNPNTSNIQLSPLPIAPSATFIPLPTEEPTQMPTQIPSPTPTLTPTPTPFSENMVLYPAYATFFHYSGEAGNQYISSCEPNFFILPIEQALEKQRLAQEYNQRKERFNSIDSRIIFAGVQENYLKELDSLADNYGRRSFDGENLSVLLDEYNNEATQLLRKYMTISIDSIFNTDGFHASQEYSDSFKARIESELNNVLSHTDTSTLESLTNTYIYIFNEAPFRYALEYVYYNATSEITGPEVFFVVSNPPWCEKFILNFNTFYRPSDLPEGSYQRQPEDLWEIIYPSDLQNA